MLKFSIFKANSLWLDQWWVKRNRLNK